MWGLAQAYSWSPGTIYELDLEEMVFWARGVQWISDQINNNG